MASPLILVASATANTGGHAVRALSAAGARVRALVRKLDDPRAAPLAALPGVTLVAGDFDDAASVRAALAGVSRAFLVSGAFAYEQFDREVGFIEAAVAAGVELVVRVGTCSSLIKPGTKGAYGRAHHGIKSFIEDMGFPVVSLNPNWYFSNALANAAEAKATGKITWPSSGTGPRKYAFVDTSDVGAAAAALLALPSEKLAPFLAKRELEVHGPAGVNFADVAAALSKAAGYGIALNAVPAAAWVDAMVGYGLPRVFAQSFCDTILQADGVLPAGYPPKTIERAPDMLDSSPELLAIGWKPKVTLEAWAESVKGAFARA